MTTQAEVEIEAQQKLYYYYLVEIAHPCLNRLSPNLRTQAEAEDLKAFLVDMQDLKQVYISCNYFLLDDATDIKALEAELFSESTLYWT